MLKRSVEERGTAELGDLALQAVCVFFIFCLIFLKNHKYKCETVVQACSKKGKKSCL